MNNLATTQRGPAAGGSKAAVKKYLAANVSLLAGLLPRGLDEKRMARIAIQCFREIPKLAMCTPESLIGGILASAQTGLALGKGAGGEAYLIPFGREATFVVGVPGRIKLAYRSGHIKAARCGIVYADQHFEANPVTGEFAIGMLDPDTNYDAEAGVYFWASVETVAGGTISHYFNRPTIESRRQKLQSKNSPAWRDHFDEMAVNMTLRYVLKRCPKSAEQERAEVLDSRVIRPGDGSLVASWVETDNGDDAVIDVTPEAEPAKAETAQGDPKLITMIEGHLDTEYGIKADEVYDRLCALFQENALVGMGQTWFQIRDKEWEAVKKVLDSVVD